MTANDENNNFNTMSYFNEFEITKSLAKRYYKKDDFEKAAEYYERILAQPQSVNDVKTRVLLSKCQQNLFRPDAALENQLLAESIDPDSPSVIENKATLLIETAEYEWSIWHYNRGTEKESFPKVFTKGIMKVHGILNDTAIPHARRKYGNGCLGETVTQLARDRHALLKVTRGNQKYDVEDGHFKRKKEMLYLRAMAREKTYFEQMSKSERPRPPFYESRKRALSEALTMIDPPNQIVKTSYPKKPVYVHWCEVNKKTGARLQNELARAKSKTMDGRVQIAKYMNDIREMIKKNEIDEAKYKTELLMQYKDKISYKRHEALYWIFCSFGIDQYVKFRNVDEWTEEDNYRRKLMLLGLEENSIRYRESLFGRNYVNPK